MYYLVQQSSTSCQAADPKRSVQHCTKKCKTFIEKRDPRPDAALDPKPLNQERKKKKISPSLLQRQATLADSWAEGYVGGNDFQNTIAPAAKQLQQSWDPEAFREAGLHLPVFL